eukprot:TRINITY_DN30039_c0_g1_i1.p2 TRINITY_DN30039_c0_g1~~TRINITY_DN30039_c0_g1_i1.p2  ORF type:complete len:774 (+),score=280.51 TRINITY_DN30039_c0_g1_i1:46-2367(+)
MLVSVLGSVALSAAGGGARPCDGGPLAGSPFCDPARPAEERAAWLVRNLTTAEKGSLMSFNAAGVDRLGLPFYNWYNEGLHGVAWSIGVSFTGDTPYATSFPQVITTSASWNRTLWRAVGGAVSTEGRAFNNAGHAGLTFWTPNINIIRDPRWGRGQETPGEDPMLTSQYANWFVTAFEGRTPPAKTATVEGAAAPKTPLENGPYLKGSACCKHFYGYDLEDWHSVTRYAFDAVINKQDEADTYLPQFHSCVTTANVSSLMCSYNSVNGTPSCMNGGAMNDLARGAWGFDGYITSDCGAVEFITVPRFKDGPLGAVRDTLGAGMDIDCGPLFRYGGVEASVAAGVTPIASVDRALVNLFKTQLRLGMFDPAAQQPFMNISTDAIRSSAHQELAREAALQGVVLLKNTGGVLPLTGKGLKVAVIGPHANATVAMQGNYFGRAAHIVSPAEGLQRYADVTVEVGCYVDTVCPLVDTAAVEAAAKAADVVVLAVGLGQLQEREGADRSGIGFPGQQAALISAAAAAAKGPVVAVVIAGGPLDLTPLKAAANVDAVVWAGYPGEAGGTAVADVLFGAVNPSGRLTATQYKAEYIEKLSMFDMGMRPDAAKHNPGRTYRFYPGDVSYAFGEGYSYTTFQYDVLSTAPSGGRNDPVNVEDVLAGCTSANAAQAYSPRASDATLLTVRVRVKNTGKRAGADVVQLFAVPPRPGADGAPLKSLVDFEKVHLEPGAEAVVAFTLSYYALSLADASGLRQPAVGTWRLEVNFNAAATHDVLVL